MMYSDKNDAVYCFPCKLFGCSGLSTSAIASTGFTDWKNMSCTLKTHECSERHFDCILKWKELICRLQMNATISQAQLDEVQAERRKWRLILERMIAISLSLAERNLAFRGHREKLWEHGNGNFLKEAELLAKFDPVMESHLTHVSTSPSRCVHYMSKDIQNELLGVIANHIKEAILQEVHENKYYSIMLDCTPDVSHIEQMAVIIQTTKFIECHMKISEYFLGFLDVSTSSTGEAIKEAFLHFLEEDLKIDFQNCRGQSYDNGANMSGKYKGVKSRLLQLNS